MRIVRHVAGDDIGKQHDLGIGKQNAELGPGQRLAARLALGQRRRRRQRLDGAVEQAARLERAHEADLVRESRPSPCLRGTRKRQRLLVVVGEHELRRLRRSSRQQLVARRARSALPLRIAEASAILMLTSTSEQLTPPELSIASELQAPPSRPNSMRARWVTPRLAPSPITLARTSARGDADRIIGAVAGVLVALACRPDIGADAAEPQQVDWRLEDRIHDLGRRRGGLVKADRGGGLRRQRDRLLVARNDDAAGRQLRLVVVLPARARQREHALALGHRGGHVRDPDR